MPTNRKTVFANGEIYHVFNRGVEKRPTFTSKKELIRAVETLKYYRFQNITPRFSHFLNLDDKSQALVLDRTNNLSKHAEVLAYCFMPNHFHLLLKQISDGGISKFVANFTNSYTKYFNKKNDRIGPLFQGLFKAVHIENDEQLIHVSRYIHLNPVSSFLIEANRLRSYEWSSYPEYTNIYASTIINKNDVLSFFPKLEDYEKFVLDQVDYARTLEKIKHLTFEG